MPKWRDYAMVGLTAYLSQSLAQGSHLTENANAL